MRRRAADYIRHEKEEFLPFLTDANGDQLAASAFDGYCEQVEGKSGGRDGLSRAWGGEPEVDCNHR